MLPREIAPGLYRTVTGTEALAWGLVAGANCRRCRCSVLLLSDHPGLAAAAHRWPRLKQFGVTTFQAEDEIAAVCAAIGASYAGQLGITSSSGPGIALKTEAIGLAIMTELPLVIINSQRGGPSTGLPTKTEQSDLYQAVYGRNADSPLVVIASHGPGDCFDAAIEAVRIATKFMTPVMLLSDGYIANAAEPWRFPTSTTLRAVPGRLPHRPGRASSPSCAIEETLARVWAKPGTPGLMHRIGGIEKAFGSGHIDYAPANHQKMTDTRAAKIDGIANDIPEQAVELGKPSGKLCVVGWGSTYGPISRAVANLLAEGHAVAHIHLRHIWPLPRNLKALLSGYEQVLVPEMNNGQLVALLRAETLIDAQPLTKIAGRPFKIAEIEAPPSSPPAGGLSHERPDPARQAAPPRTFATDQEVRWCPGCGDYAILKAMQKTLADVGAHPGEDGIRLRHRLRRALSLLHGDLRLPHHPRPRAGLRHRHQAGQSGARRLGGHRRRRCAVDRRQPPDPHCSGAT